LRIGGRPWRCIVGYGHAPEHIVAALRRAEPADLGRHGAAAHLHQCQRFDMEPEGNPLPLYLDSISALRRCRHDTLVLPSHGLPFTGLHTRIDQLHQHHEERLAEVLGACAPRPCNAAELLPVLFKRELDLHQTTFAMGEAIAHVHALVADGRLCGWPTAAARCATARPDSGPRTPKQDGDRPGWNPPCRRDAEPPSPDVLTPTW
jgi:glyoxylase-like metal-dependent hydrolase (beta-lactamase superfamily II)